MSNGTKRSNRRFIKVLRQWIVLFAVSQSDFIKAPSGRLPLVFL